MTTILDRLCRWYSVQCDGEWEHQYGVRIETLDNPGWLIKIDLVGTTLATAAHPAAAVVDRSETDWVHAKIEAGQFALACGPNNLEEAIHYFLEFASRGT